MIRKEEEENKSKLVPDKNSSSSYQTDYSKYQPFIDEIVK